MSRSVWVVIGKADAGYIQGLVIKDGGWLVPVTDRPATLFADQQSAQAAIDATKANQTDENRHIVEFYVVPAEE